MQPPRDRPWSLTARWIFPGDAPPIERGVLTIHGERIVSLQSNAARKADFDLGDTAVIPGLVNAHTHLDLSNLAGKLPPSPDFIQWLRGIGAHRRQETPDQTVAAIESGLRQSLAHGVTLLGDIAVGGRSWKSLARFPLRAVVYFEMIGLTADRAAQALDAADQWLQGHPATATLRPGLSPHAPYSVRVSIFEEAARRNREGGIPVSTHLGESWAEFVLPDGPFADFLRELGVYDPQGFVHDLETIVRLYCTGKGTSLVHANCLDAGTDFGNTAVIYCPRTHAAFGHTPHLFRHWFTRGVTVALGTDSLASNPDLSILGELRFLHERYPDVWGDMLLRMATINGARALGWEHETGSLAPGKSADFVCLPWSLPTHADPFLALLESKAEPTNVFFRGMPSFHS
ncbi:MAG: amidohydrolase family protein [Gemmataceae bacterium]|nr:amidohydrolase family protein [Gemmataceae bacterium]MCI0740281.1 amidohydrolase family protein [Gemmataceae bacterium]